MAIYIINYDPGMIGCPIVLKGDLNKPWSWDEHDPNPEAFNISGGYVYKSKEKVLDFDYWDINWMASEDFVRVCEQFGLGVRGVPVDVLQSDGRLTKKKYFYLLWSEWASVIDVEQSNIEFEKDLATGEIAHHKYFPDVPVALSVERFVVKDYKIPKSAAFKCLDLDYALVCNEDFKAACEKARLIGLTFDNVTNYKKDGFWG